MDHDTVNKLCKETLTDLDSIPVVKTYPHQQSLSCYGRGRRLCDIELPRIPAFLLHDKEHKTEEFGASDGVGKARPGRGRGKARRSKARDENTVPGHSPSPNGLHEYTFSRGTYSVSSAESGDNMKDNLDDCFELHHKELISVTPLLESPHSHDDSRNISCSSPPRRIDNDSPVIDSAVEYTQQPIMKNLVGWTVTPPNVCQLEGIPINLDLKIINDLLASYGSIVDWEEKRSDDSISLRIKFDRAAVCDEVEANIDESDFSGTGSVVRCRHLRR